MLGLGPDHLCTRDQPLQIQLQLPANQESSVGICDPLGRSLLEKRYTPARTEQYLLHIDPSTLPRISGQHRIYLLTGNRSWWTPLRFQENTPSLLHLRYTTWFDLQDPSIGPLRNFQVRIGLPDSTGPIQQINNLWASRMPAHVEHPPPGDRSWIVHPRRWHEGPLRFRTDVDLTLRTVRFDLDEIARESPYLSRPPRPRTPLPSEEGIESQAPLILEAANNLGPPETSTLALLRSAHQFVRDQIRYVVQPEEYGALKGLQEGKGDCTEMAALLAALCRARGIPARVNVGRFASSPDLHAVTEISLSGFWIPIDVTHSEPGEWPGFDDPFLVLGRSNWMSRHTSPQKIQVEYWSPHTANLNFTERTRLTRIAGGKPPPSARNGLGGPISLGVNLECPEIELHWTSERKVLSLNIENRISPFLGTALITLGDEGLRVLRVINIEMTRGQRLSFSLELPIQQLGPFEARDLKVLLFESSGHQLLERSPIS